MSDGSNAPKERINISYKAKTNGAAADVELPLKLMVMYADEIVDIQDDVHYTEMYNELSKYKTLSHSEIDWHKVYMTPIQPITNNIYDKT